MGNLTDELKRIPAWGWLAAAIIVVGAWYALHKSRQSSTANQPTSVSPTGGDMNAGVQGDTNTLILEQLQSIEQLLGEQQNTQNNAGSLAGNNGSFLSNALPHCPPGFAPVPMHMGVDSSYGGQGYRCVDVTKLPTWLGGTATPPAPSGITAISEGAGATSSIHAIAVAPPVAIHPIASTTVSRSYTVVRGDTLSGIAQKVYGNASLWPKIYNANKGVIGSNPNLIYAGQHYTIP